MNVETKICQNCKQNFVIDPEDFEFYAKIKVPAPTFCPQCRAQRRYSFRNERYLYKRACDFCQKNMITYIAPDYDYTIYCQQDWWSDKWDPKQYGQDYDFSKPFFEQIKDLWRRVPWPTLSNSYTTLVNSEYVHMCSDSKNCYLTTHADHNEDCAYSSGLKLSKDVFDATMVRGTEFSYECLNVVKGYRNFYSVDCETSRDIYFSKNLVSCDNCIGCVNLRHKSFHIFNKQYSKEEYGQKLKEFDFGSRKNVDEFRKKAEVLWREQASKYYHGSHNVNVSGDYIYESKNAQYCYEMIGAEDCKYSQFLSTKPSKDCYDYTEWGQGAELMYEVMVSGDSVQNVRFANVVYSSHDVEYSAHISGSHDIFGCIGLKQSEYCILNKQYSKEEFRSLRKKIIEQMSLKPYKDVKGRVYSYGEFFPIDMTPFAYNETAQEFFPLGKEQALSNGFRWREKDQRDYQPSTYTIPDHINDVQDDVLQAILACKKCGRNYRLIPMELDFYRKAAVSVPQKCYECRHFERVQYRSPLVMAVRMCGKCGREVNTHIADHISPVVYCEQCYQAEVV